MMEFLQIAISEIKRKMKKRRRLQVTGVDLMKK